MRSLVSEVISSLPRAQLRGRSHEPAQCLALPHARATLGCFFGISYSAFEQSDDEQWKVVGRHASGSGGAADVGNSSRHARQLVAHAHSGFKPPRTLDTWCAGFVGRSAAPPTGSDALNASERRTYLACVAGGALDLKWRVEQYALAPSLIEGFCAGNFASDEAEHLRATAGLSAQALALCQSIALCGSPQGSPKGLLPSSRREHDAHDVASLCEMGAELWE